jgi:Zn-dependent protease with chaperone function
MNLAVYLPLLLALPLSPVARRIADRGAPGPAVRGLTAVALVTAICSTWSLTLLALTLVDDVPALEALDERLSLRLPKPVPDPVALVATLLLAWGAVRLVARLGRRAGTHRRLRAAGVPQDGLVIADWAAPLAIAVPGRPGHLLVTTGILRLLDADERRVVFAHERAHLAHRHHRLAAAAAAAAAVNPLLTGVRDTIAYLLERQADEDAAAAVGDRDLTAQAVARAALATLDGGPATALGIHGGGAVDRVRALGAPSPAPRRWRLLGPLLVGAGCLAAIGVATVEFIELARAWL